MNAVKSFLLVCLLTGAAWAQEGVTLPAPPPDVEILFSFVGTRTQSQLVENSRNIHTPGLQFTGPYTADLGVDPQYIRSVTELSRRPVSMKYALLRLKNTGPKTIKTIVWEVPHMHFKDGQLQWRLVIHSKM